MHISQHFSIFMYKVTYNIYVYKYAFMSLEFLCERFERCYKRMPFRNKLYYYYYYYYLYFLHMFKVLYND